MTGDIKRIAMWSGPRNLSTTLMRSFAARADTLVIDEPFYAAYLAISRLDHPMGDQIRSSHETDPEAVARCLLGPVPNGRTIFYQKQMTHHMIDGIGLDWMEHGSLRHCFLIRHPARVIVSYQRKMETLSVEAIGTVRQVQLYHHVTRLTGQPGDVIDADRVLEDPEAVLKRLCDAIGISWDPAMLDWPAGPRPEDGVWAPHWYDNAWTQSGFGPPPGPLPDLVDAEAQSVLEATLPAYQQLLARHI